MSILATGCFFTGVESTPRITAGEVRREVPPAAPEDTFLTRVGDEPLRLWKPGKQFRITDARVSRIFGASARSLEGIDPTGENLIWQGTEESPSPLGETVTDLIFTTQRGQRLVYRINRPLSRLLADSVTEVPFTIQLSTVEAASHMLTGRDFWVTTSLWRDDEDSPVKGRKYVKVHIDSVSAGNSIFPLKISFTDPTGRSARLFIHPGSKGRTPRTFSQVFSFTDPRQRYPHISPEHWQLIIDSRVEPGMTTEECRLALGSPKEVDRGANNSFLLEAWLYDNGTLLLFEDGVLKRRR